MRDNSTWNRQTVLENEGITIDYMTSARGLNTFKATGQLPYPAWLIYNCISQPEIRKLVAKNEDKFRIIEKLCTNTLAGWQCSKKVGVGFISVQPRDFIVCAHHDILPSGVISIVAYGDDKKEHLVPEEKQYLRGTLHIAGWSLTPVKDKEGKEATDLCLITEVDLKGSMPQMVLKVGNKKQSMQIQHLREAIGDYVRQNNIKF